MKKCTKTAQKVVPLGPIPLEVLFPSLYPSPSGLIIFCLRSKTAKSRWWYSNESMGEVAVMQS